MKLIFLNLKKGEIKVEIQSLDDLWYLYGLIEQHDFIKGRTYRKIKMTEQAEAVRKPIFVALDVESVDFSDSSSALRISGKILEGPEDVPRGSYQSISLEPNSTVLIKKEKWYSYQLDRVKEACAEKIPKILLVVFDREEAFFALMKRSGYEILAHLKGIVVKKRFEEKVKVSFYDAVIDQIKDYDERFSLDKIILASPAFWKEELFKSLKDESVRKKIIQATCSSVDETSFNEVLKRDEVKSALQEERVSKEFAFVEYLFAEIAKKGNAEYGLARVELASSYGAIEILIVSDKFIKKMRLEKSFDRLDHIMKRVDEKKGKIVIVSSDHDGGKKLDGLGGIGAILRYKVE